MNPDYKSRTVKEWMDLMHDGNLALTDFQRSHVWPPTLTTNFLKAVLRDDTTGTILLVRTGADLGKRNIQGNGSDIENADSLVLDGQQRLTSLWQGLMDASDSLYYYVEVTDISILSFDVSGVIHRRPDSQGYKTPLEQYSKNLIPLNVLYDAPGESEGSLTGVQEWCQEVKPTDTAGAMQLVQAIEQNLRIRLEQHKIWYAEFENINADEAVRIFVETNSSSVSVQPFDLAVAEGLQISSDIRLRERIQGFRNGHDRIKYYFHSEEERWIPEIGEVILKIACLKTDEDGLPPKKGNYKDALKHVFSYGVKGKDDRYEKADSAESNLETTLQFLEDRGIPTRDILPRIPPVYVIAALQDDLGKIHVADRAKAITLLETYFWRSFFSDRYVSQANDRLYQDFKDLRKDIRRIEKQGEASWDAPIFREAKVTGKLALYAASRVFRSKSPLGNAIIAVAARNGAKDWVTGEPLTAGQLRRLEDGQTLDRHHVFPRKALTNKNNGGLDKKAATINHGLNIVLINKEGNINLGGREPAEYLLQLKERDPQLTDEMLRNRIQSHLVPFDELICTEGTVKARYSTYLKARANMLHNKIVELTRIPK